MTRSTFQPRDLTEWTSAPDEDRERRFRVTHSFHPLFSREYELLHYRQCWGDDRVFYHDEQGELRSIPARWTSAVGDDPFVVVSGGRSLFRTTDLLELAELIRGLQR